MQAGQTFLGLQRYNDQSLWQRLNYFTFILLFLSISKPIYIYIYFACLSVCLYWACLLICLYLMHVKTNSSFFLDVFVQTAEPNRIHLWINFYPKLFHLLFFPLKYAGGPKNRLFYVYYSLSQFYFYMLWHFSNR